MIFEIEEKQLKEKNNIDTTYMSLTKW